MFSVYSCIHSICLQVKKRPFIFQNYSEKQGNVLKKVYLDLRI